MWKLGLPFQEASNKAEDSSENTGKIKDKEFSLEGSEVFDSDSDMAPVVGAIEHYLEGEDLQEWLERFDAFVETNQVDPKDQTSWLLVYCGKVIYRLARVVSSPMKPSEVEYKVLKEKLLTAVKADHVAEVSRQAFYSRVQEPGETVSDFALALKELAADCDFQSHLDAVLRDRLIYNLSDPFVKSQLIKAKKDTFDDAVKEALILELASPNVMGINRFMRKSVGPDSSRVSAAKSFKRKKLLGPQNTHDTFNDNRCSTCGRDRRNKAHQDGVCPAVKNGWICHRCRRTGHTRAVCRSKVDKQEQICGNQIEEKEMKQNKEADTEDDYYHLNSGEYLNLCTLHNILPCKAQTKPPLIIKLSINGKSFDCEVDSGACVTVFSYQQYKSYLKDSILRPIAGNKKFCNADGHSCAVRGIITVDVNGVVGLQALVIDAKYRAMPLIGRTWLEVLCSGWREFFYNCFEQLAVKQLACKEQKVEKVNNMYEPGTQGMVELIKRDYKQVFEPSDEPIKHFKASFKLKEGSRPIFLKATSPPYALRDEIARQLKGLEEKGIIKYVEHSEWASKLVVAPKKNGELRLCVNYRTTLNDNLQDNHYPLPVVEDILLTLGGNSCFVSLDLQGAYHQLLLDGDSQLFTTVNTHLGLYQYLRLPFGVKTAPAIFQGVMEQILHGLHGVQVYLDDILIGGKDLDECHGRLRTVLDRLKEYNVRVNFEKCKFFTDELEFLGHYITKDGIAPGKTKMTALVNAPRPRDVSQLRSFLGGVNYYSKFVQNLQSLLHPLHRLLQKGVPFEWTVECQECFENVKQRLQNSAMLARYDPSKSITIICDASPYGVGAVLNVIENGEERPCFMVSASLKPAQQNYSQLHREAYAIVFSVTKYHKFIYGKKVTIFTDCKALESILSKSNNLDGVINSRFLRWILFLQNYDIEIKYRPSKQTACADVLSRLPLEEETGTEGEELSYLSLGVLNEVGELNLSREEIAEEMTNDRLAGQILQYVIEGWPLDKKDVPVHLNRFYSIKDNLDVDGKCLYYGERIYIPVRLRETVLKKLHDQHDGMVKCKQVARRYGWWPGIDGDIEAFIRQCNTCQLCADNKRQYPLMSWQKSDYPFQRIHLDHFFFNNQKFLIVKDTFSGWIYVDVNRFIDTHCVILSLRKFFANFGLPKTIVTDNGTAFKSEVFEKFCKINQIDHITSPPYHPQSNGAAERSVGIVKKNLKKHLLENSNKFSLEVQLQKFLFNQHHTPGADGYTPAEKIFNFKPKTIFSQLQKNTTNSEGSLVMTPRKTKSLIELSSKPVDPVNVKLSCKLNSELRGSQKVEEKKIKNTKVEVEKSKKVECKMHEDKLNKMKLKKALMVNQLVYVYWPRGVPKFVEGIIVAKTSPLTYQVKLSNGNVVKVHRDSLKPREQKKSIFIYRSLNGSNSNSKVVTNSQGLRRSTLNEQTPQPSTSRTTEDQNRLDTGQPWSLRQKPRIDYKRFF